MVDAVAVCLDSGGLCFAKRGFPDHANGLLEQEEGASKLKVWPCQEVVHLTRSEIASPGKGLPNQDRERGLPSQERGRGLPK